MLVSHSTTQSLLFLQLSNTSQKSSSQSLIYRKWFRSSLGFRRALTNFLLNCVCEAVLYKLHQNWKFYSLWWRNELKSFTFYLRNKEKRIVTVSKPIFFLPSLLSLKFWKEYASLLYYKLKCSFYKSEKLLFGLYYCSH